MQLARLAKANTDKVYEIKTEFEREIFSLLGQIKRETRLKEEFYEEIQKYKKESLGYYSGGGFGTFTIAFENPVHSQLVKMQ